MVAGYHKAAVLAFKAPSRKPGFELHCWLAGAQDSLRLELEGSAPLCPTDEPLGYTEI